MYEGYHIIHSCSDNGQSGVALMMDSKFSKALINSETIGSRIVVARFARTPVNTTIIQCYMSTKNEEDTEIEEMCTQNEEYESRRKRNNNGRLERCCW